MDFKGLSTVEMESLVGVLFDEAEPPTADVYDVPIHGPPQSEEVIFRMPQVLIDRLAQMDPTALEDCLARRAVAKNRQVFTWMCP